VGSVQRTYEVGAFNSGDLSDGSEAGDAEEDTAQPLLQLQGCRLRGDSMSVRSSTSIASEVYHEQPAADVGPQDVLRTVEFHLLVFCSFVTMGATFSVLNKFEQLIGALVPRKSGHGAPTEAEVVEKHHELREALVMCFSVCNVFGSLLAGYVSEQALRVRVRYALVSVCARSGSLNLFLGAAVLVANNAQCSQVFVGLTQGRACLMT
jgi:hypothetical protein